MRHDPTPEETRSRPVRAGPRRFAWLAAASLVLLAPGHTREDPAVRWPGPKVRGVVISTHTNGVEWGWDEMGATLEDIRLIGGRWIATHPYAGIRPDGSVRFRDFDPRDPPPHLIRPIREARRRGLKTLITPHLAHWGTPFSWRGEIAFETPEQWSRFWRDYERWIVKLAAACREADGFVVGSELDRTLASEAEWRRIIARIRTVSRSRLTYAANWTDYRNVPFWDALDAIGVQAYFPLADQPAPAESVLVQAWAAWMGRLRQYSKQRGRPVLFTELGYNRSFEAARRPWESRVDGPEAEAFQATCLRVALRAVEAEPSVIGAFLWKWFPNPHPVGRNFQLATPRLRRTIAEVWN